jgi:prophage regulatory protein
MNAHESQQDAKGLPLNDLMVDVTEVLRSRGQSARSVIHCEQRAGIFIEPIQLSARCSRYYASEVEALNAARAAGASDDELRDLVRQLRERRKTRAALARARALGAAQ